jgi:hypothetical protein
MLDGATGVTGFFSKLKVFLKRSFRTRRAKVAAGVITPVIIILGMIFVGLAFRGADQPPGVAPQSKPGGAQEQAPAANDQSSPESGASNTDSDKPNTTPQSGGNNNQGGQGATSNDATGGPSSGGSTESGGSSGGTGSTAQSCPAYPTFPDANCTGVPAGVSLSTYTGPCTITDNDTIIDSKTVNCDLEIQATNVQIKSSRINGTLSTPNGSLAYSFTITDSEVIAPQATAIEQNGIGEANFTALRVEVTGGNRGVYCRKDCTLRDSWIHGTNIADTPRIHASAIRQSQGATIVHNRLHCSAEDTSSGGGCSANLTGYGDFEPVQDNRIEKNLFVATPGGACAYGGSSGDDGAKPYGDQASGIVFIDNVFERGSTGNCGFYFPITDFDSARPGNEWTNNKWDDGSEVPPAN